MLNKTLGYSPKARRMNRTQEELEEETREGWRTISKKSTKTGHREEDFKQDLNQ